MKTVPRSFGMLVILLVIVAPACINRIFVQNGVDPEDIVYNSVPGYGAGGGTDILEWTAKSSSTQGEKQVPSSLKPARGLNIRWLGTAGFEISDDDTTILLDPFVTRPSVEDSFNPFKPLRVDTGAVDKYVLKPIQASKPTPAEGMRKIKAILISHTHDDHVLDAPYVLAKFPKAADRPLIAGDPNLIDVLRRYAGQEKEISWLKGVDPLDQTRSVIIEFNKKQKLEPDASPLARPIPGAFGHFKITAFISEHGLYDDIPLNHEGNISGKAPFTGADLRAYLNSSLTYLIEYKGLRIFAADSPRFLHIERVSAEVMAGGRIDVLLQGIASRKARDDDGTPLSNDLPQRIKGFQPRYFIPTHFDNFFVPLKHFKIFDYQINVVTDNSDLKGFIDGYRNDSCLNTDPCPNLRMMKMFYYYSLEKLLP